MPRNVIDGDPLFANEFVAMQRAALGDYVVSGLELSINGGSGLQVDVDAGTYRVGEVEYEAAATNVTLDSGSAFDRYDTLAIDSAGVVSASKGLVEKVAPVIPDGETFIGLAFIEASASSITAAELVDGRVLSDLLPPGQTDGTNITLNSTHNQDVLYLTGTSTVTLDGSAVEDGFTCTIVNDGSGTIDFSSTDTIRSEGSLVELTGQYRAAWLIWKDASSAWYLFGALS